MKEPVGVVEAHGMRRADKVGRTVEGMVWVVGRRVAGEMRLLMLLVMMILLLVKEVVVALEEGRIGCEAAVGDTASCRWRRQWVLVLVQVQVRQRVTGLNWRSSTDAAHDHTRCGGQRMGRRRAGCQTSGARRIDASLLASRQVRPGGVQNLLVGRRRVVRVLVA